MSLRPSLLLVTSWLVLPGLALAQESTELTPEKVAEIRRDETQARAKVDAEFGNRKPSEMSSEERALAIEKQQAASSSVMEKHGISAKDYARYEARMGPEANARAKAEEKRLEEQAAQAAKQSGPTGEKAAEDVAVVNGFSDEDPVELEAEEGAEPVVDVGIPGAQEAESFMMGSGAAPENKPVKRAAARSSGVKKKKASRRQRGSDE
jgi:hypothetical protein